MPTLSPLVEQGLYRVVQEALTNAVKHAPDSAIRVRITHEADRTRVSVVNAAPSADGPAHASEAPATGPRLRLPARSRPFRAPAARRPLRVLPFRPRPVRRGRPLPALLVRRHAGDEGHRVRKPALTRDLCPARG
ncbi:ATP-binding protein [Streptomyces sp. PTD5-9]|uniref:ATP-binding protein n=1 Tax=Streptomyces sp. PTD5-9 TaxID=3120150 RepID=UPI003FCE8EBC